VERLTIQEAALTTGWSARMLRYVEQAGLVRADRSPAGYRLYGPAQLQRLRTLRELLTRYGIELSEVGFAARLRRETHLARAVYDWLESEPRRPEDVSADGWLRWEQDKHKALLSAAASPHDDMTS
jgi:MerR family transcriptional regulator, copper efflux regulator